MAHSELFTDLPIDTDPSTLAIACAPDVGYLTDALLNGGYEFPIGGLEPFTACRGVDREELFNAGLVGVYDGFRTYTRGDLPLHLTAAALVAMVEASKDIWTRAVPLDGNTVRHHLSVDRGHRVEVPDYLPDYDGLPDHILDV